MKVCYVCDTPYQVLNCINHRYHSSQDYADLFIGEQFYNWESISATLRDERLFSNVFTYECPGKQGLFKYLCGKIGEIINIESRMKTWLRRPTELSNYDVIFMSLYTRFSYGMRELNPKAEVVFFEDGCGTYLGKEHEWGFEKRRMIFRLLGKSFPELQYSHLLVNNLDFYKLNNPDQEEVEALPKFNLEDSAYINLLLRVFGVHDDTYRGQKVVYLSEPHESGFKKYEEIEKNILNCINHEVEDFVLRLHPRQSDEDYSGYNIDRERVLWELVVLQSITNRNILVGSFSTAQLVPKLLYGLEPTLIFTYPLLYGNNNEQIERLETIVKNLRNIYSDPQQVVVARCYNDISKVIRANSERHNEVGGI